LYLIAATSATRMSGTGYRLSPAVSRGELERRWALARASMQEFGCDALVVRGAANKRRSGQAQGVSVLASRKPT
jgi:hypothetical protein